MEKKIIEVTPLVIIVSLFIFNFCWFWPLESKGIIMGDDLKLVTYFSDMSKGFFEKVNITSEFLNYRPIAYTIIAVEVLLFGKNYLGYFVFQVLLNYVIVISIFYIVKILNDNSNIYSLLAALLYIISPCSYYGITQIFGTMELLCIFFGIWFFYFGYKYIQSKNKNYFYLEILLYFAMLYTHERYMVLYGILFILVLMGKEKGEKKKLIILRLLIALCPLILNILIKTLVLKIKFFEGTGGTAIKFNFTSFFDILKRGILLTFGINLGPEYLNAMTFPYLGKILQISLIVSLILQVVFVIFYLLNSIKKDKRVSDDIKLFFLGIIYYYFILHDFQSSKIS